MPFYEYSQNNSGGGMTVNSQLTHRQFIEADTAKQANKKTKALGGYFNGCRKGIDCSCCGDRWYKGEELVFPLKWSDNQYIATVEEYADLLLKQHSYVKSGQVETRIYYADGSVKELVAL